MLLAAGATATCVARNEQTFCWGAVPSPGASDLNFGVSPRLVAALSPAVDLAVTAGQACSVHPDGGTTCVALVEDGGVEVQRRGSGPAMTKLDASATGPICGLLTNGSVLCWGWNGYGELGIGASSNGRVGVNAQSQPVQNITDAIDVEVGGWFACALRQPAAVSCWGMLVFPTSASPGTRCFNTDCALVPVASSLPANIPLSLGGIGGCALDASGVLSCWGASVPKELTDGGTGGPRPPPLEVRGDVAAVWPGYGNNCLKTLQGELLCWPGAHNPTNADPSVRAVPLANVSQVASGYYHSCAVHEVDRLSCWGENENGQLGDGTNVTHAEPTEVVIPAE